MNMREAEREKEKKEKKRRKQPTIPCHLVAFEMVG